MHKNLHTEICTFQTLYNAGQRKSECLQVKTVSSYDEILAEN